MSYSGAGSGGNIHTDGDVALNNPSDGQVLEYNASLAKWQNQTAAVAIQATTSTSGTVQLSGDLSGIATAPIVAKINGVTVTGTPSTGQILMATSGTAASWQAGSSGSSSSNLTTTSVRTSAYSAGSNQLIPTDASTAGFTVTLPTAPTDGTVILVKKIDSSTNIVTVATSGSDVFNKSGGVTSLTLSIQYQALTVQYAASTSIWYVAGDDLPLSQLDLRYEHVVSDAGTWSTTTAYTSGQIVTYSGARYMTPSGAPSNSFFDTSRWVLLGSVPDTF